MFQITSATNGITALNGTINDPNYFNTLWGVTDSVVTKIADPTPEEIAAQIEKDNTEKQSAQAQSIINAKIQANRLAYVDALISNDTATQATIQTAQAALLAPSAQIVLQGEVITP